MFHNGITVAVRSGTDDWQKRFLLGWLELSQVPGSSGRVAAARPIPAFCMGRVRNCLNVYKCRGRLRPFTGGNIFRPAH
jgi:hypothetical protein